MNNDRILRKIFNTKPEGVRNLGRPKMRSEDGVNQDMETLGVRTGSMQPSTETNRHTFFKRPRPTKGYRVADDDDIRCKTAL